MIFTLAIRNLIHDRMRFFVTLIGIVFSIVLVAVQTGLYLGSERLILNMIDHTDADIWIVAKGAESFDDASKLEGRERYTALSTPGVASASDLVVGFSKWTRDGGGDTAIVIVGVNPGEGQLEPWNVVSGKVDDLKLSEAVAVDNSYFRELGVSGVGGTGKIEGVKTRVVAITSGIRSFTTLPYVFTSKRQARTYFRIPSDKSTFITVKVEPGANVKSVQKALAQRFDDAEVKTTQEFRDISKQHWLFNTGAGAALIGGAILGIIVGVVIVAQTLYSSAKDHIREFATLRALGSTAGYIHKVILWQAILSAIIGYVIAIAIDYAIVWASEGSALPIVATQSQFMWLFVLTVVMCVFSAMAAIVKVTRIDPAMVFAS